jgi:hypothetical protein
MGVALQYRGCFFFICVHGTLTNGKFLVYFPKQANGKFIRLSTNFVGKKRKTQKKNLTKLPWGVNRADNVYIILLFVKVCYLNTSVQRTIKFIYVVKLGMKRYKLGLLNLTCGWYTTLRSIAEISSVRLLRCGSIGSVTTQSVITILSSSNRAHTNDIN